MSALRLAVLLTMVALTGCHGGPRATADPVDYDLNQVFTLEGGHEATIRGEDLRLRFADVLEDSRCPVHVECFWTGQARIALRVQQIGHDPITVEFNTNPAPGQTVRSSRVGPYTIELTSLDPYPQTPEESIGLQDYRATLAVRRS